jgi:hypothetical protein
MIVVPTGNPFLQGNSNNNNSTSNASNTSIQELGPGINLLLDQVMVVNHDRIIVWVEPPTLLSFQRVLQTLLEGLGRLAKEYNCPVTSHMSESIDEVEWTCQLDVLDHCDKILPHNQDKNNHNHHRCSPRGRWDAKIFHSHGWIIDLSMHYGACCLFDGPRCHGFARFWCGHCPLSLVILPVVVDI